MKKHFRLFLPLGFLALSLLLLISCNSQTSSASDQTVRQQTVVYLVRHAEKDTSDQKNEDPSLTPAGQERAQALNALLANDSIGALFATKYIRTRQTLEPIAQARSLTIETYEAHDFTGLASKIKQEHAGQTVVVAGHSNTLLPLIEALGGKKPFQEITEAQYDYLFKVTLRNGQETQVEVLQVGTPAR